MNKMTKKSWFEVSRKGLRELQAGKPKDFILKELIQNAWDEDGITYCRIRAYKNPGIATISIEDDAPEGFKDLSHAFTLFSPTYKRSDPKKRGRFNIGEKQVLAICRAASISTTKGTIVFDSKGRHHRRLKRNEGSVISIIVPMNQKDFDEAIAKIRNYLPPKGIEMTMNGEPIEYREPKLIISEPLDTDVLDEDGAMRRRFRITDVHIHEIKNDEKAFLYEMGLPICELDCKYSIDVQQKVPLSIDRETVPQKYLKDIFATVLNHTHEELEEKESSEVWVRKATEHFNISKEALSSLW